MSCRVALVHDWLTGMRGGEKCLDAMCDLFPDADIFTLFHRRGSVSEKIEKHRILTSYLQKIPGSCSFYRYLLPLFPGAVENFDLSGYDLVISSSHCAAKGVKTARNQKHICYCHTPVRYVSDMARIYFDRGSFGKIRYLALKPLLKRFENWDIENSGRIDYFVANSLNVKKRILQRYNMDSTVIYPPVDTEKFYNNKSEEFYLVVSAFAPYKKVDLAIRAFNKLGKRLIVIGSGQDEKCLRKTASSNIEFLGWVGDNEIREYYSRCKAFIFPGEEDFGITPVEAQASGKPVIAYGRGGQTETVRPFDKFKNDNPTGVFFYEQKDDALVEAVKLFEDSCGFFKPENIRSNAEKFNRGRFLSEFKDFVTDRSRKGFEKGRQIGEIKKK
ncbi:MAG: glycosyltransferase [Candidatus Aureabacteria bacterium]|nr:glycosyltransferase [Candidatus Auribacterota bacterium]